MADIVETTISAMDDAAALGCLDVLESLANLHEVLAALSRLRLRAVEARLDGATSRAECDERCADYVIRALDDQDLDSAAAFLRNRGLVVSLVGSSS